MINTSFGYAFQYKLDPWLSEEKIIIDFYHGRYGGYIGELRYKGYVRNVYISNPERITFAGSLITLTSRKVEEVVRDIEKQHARS